MKKLLFSVFIIYAQQVFAQSGQSVDNYIFKYETAKAYTPLTSATNHTAGKDWTERLVQIPIGFNTEIGGKFADKFIFYGNGRGSFGIGTDTAGVVNRFLPIGWEGACDRGTKEGIPQSPVRYQTDGVSPNRIFKVEMFSAGFFYDILNPKSVTKDSLNIQFWIYETSNIIEIRYGSHLLTNPDPYYFPGVPVIGYVKDDSLISDASGTRSTRFTQAYILNGNPNAPVVDSILLFSSSLTGLTSYPDSGTVYRFIPKAVAASIGEINIAEQLKVYPTQATTNITVASNLNTEASADIYAVNGQKVKSNIGLQKGTNIIDISEFAAGVYFLKINATEGKADFKFVKQ